MIFTFELNFLEKVLFLHQDYGRNCTSLGIPNSVSCWVTETWSGTTWPNMTNWASFIGIRNSKPWIITFPLTNPGNSDPKAKRRVTVITELKRSFRLCLQMLKINKSPCTSFNFVMTNRELYVAAEHCQNANGFFCNKG